MKDELKHVGVKGMRWGVRKTAPTTFAERRRRKKSEKLVKKMEEDRKKDFSSPTNLYRNRKKYTQKEIDDAMKRFKWERELRTLSMDEITIGSKYVQSFLTYGGAAMSAYGMGKAIIKVLGK